MTQITDLFIQTLDIADLPHDMQEDVVTRTMQGIMQSVMIHAFMTLPLQEQHTLMELLDKDTPIQKLFAWLGEKMPDLPEVVASSLVQYASA